MTEVKAPFLRRVILRNYKSIKECDVSLRPLTLLVGPNGSGKSNFLDALRFVAESLWSSMSQAVRERGGIKALCNCSRPESDNFSIDLRLALPGGGDASYRVLIVAKPRKGFVVEEEECRIRLQNVPEARYRVRSGQVEEATFEPRPPVVPDRLYLTIASSFPEFRGVYDLLSHTRVYNINPEEIRREEISLESDSSDVLMRDGRGAGLVLWGIHDSRVRQRINEYMHVIVPDLERISVESPSEYVGRLNPQAIIPADGSNLGDEPEYLWFVLRVGEHPHHFRPISMSDGTLRAFGVLLALYQCFDRAGSPPIPLIGIEEPEAALHPAAAGVLLDALQEASYFTQVLVTTHSPDLLDTPSLDSESLLVVDMVDGATILGPADEASKSIMRDRLYTAGELMRQNQLRPETRSPGPIAADGGKS